MVQPRSYSAVSDNRINELVKRVSQLEKQISRLSSAEEKRPSSPARPFTASKRSKTKETEYGLTINGKEGSKDGSKQYKEGRPLTAQPGTPKPWARPQTPANYVTYQKQDDGDIQDSKQQPPSRPCTALGPRPLGILQSSRPSTAQKFHPKDDEKNRETPRPKSSFGAKPYLPYKRPYTPIDVDRFIDTENQRPPMKQKEDFMQLTNGNYDSVQFHNPKPPVAKKAIKIKEPNECKDTVDTEVTENVERPSDEDEVAVTQEIVKACDILEGLDLEEQPKDDDDHLEWEPSGRQSQMPSRNSRNQAIGVQTDPALDYLPTLPNEKGTMTYQAGENVRESWTPMVNHYPEHRPDTGAQQRADSQQAYNNFYQRMRENMASLRFDRPYVTIKKDPERDPGPPTSFRSGNMGSSWRHVRQTTGNLGNHICFVDGAVKEDDIKRYPPYGFQEPQDAYTYISPRLKSAPMRKSAMDQPLLNYQPETLSPSMSRKMSKGSRGSKYNQFNQHARNNFKYWYEEKQPGVSSRPAPRTISGHMLRLGIGY